MDETRVVEVIGRRLGSGYLLGQDLVLTAAHLLTVPEGEAVSAAQVRPQTEPERTWTTQLLWHQPAGHRCLGLDLALLRIGPSGEGDTGTWKGYEDLVPVRFGRVKGAEQVLILGYPYASGQEKLRELSPVLGWVHTFNGWRSGRMEIVVEGEPVTSEGWKGVSGAAVFRLGGPDREDELLGTVVTVRRSYGGRRLGMVPVRRLVKDPVAVRTLLAGGVSLPDVPGGVRGVSVGRADRFRCVAAMEEAGCRIRRSDRGLEEIHPPEGDRSLRTDCTVTYGNRPDPGRGVPKVRWRLQWRDGCLGHAVDVEPCTPYDDPSFHHETWYQATDLEVAAFEEAVSVYSQAVREVQLGKSRADIRRRLDRTVPRA
jgi:hypothetical protein